MLRNISYEFLEDILFMNETDVERICAVLQITKKQFWYKLSMLNSELESYFNIFIPHNDEHLLIDESISNKLEDIISDQTIPLHELQDDRIYFLYLYIASKDEFLSTAHFQDFFDLSRNAIMLELRKLREWTEAFDIEVIYSRRKGYILLGDERNIRRLMEESISKLKEKFDLNKIFKIFQSKWKKSIALETLTETITYLLNQNKLQIVFDRVEEFMFFILFVIKRSSSQKLYFHEQEISILVQHPIHKVAEELCSNIFNEVHENEVLFIESRLLGVIQGNSQDPNVSYFNSLVELILFKLSTIIHLSDEESERLKKTLYMHIVPAYYRLVFDMYYSNPLLDKVKNDYSELFELTKMVLKPLESEINKEISESEIAYFAIHFGGYIEKQNYEKQNRELKAVVVCPNGISSSLIMNATIKDTFPEINIVKMHNSNNLSSLDANSYDMIFSTTYFPNNKKLYTTSPILNAIERDILRDQVSADFPQLSQTNAIKAKDILDIVEKHSVINNKENLIKDLNQYIYRRDSLNERKLKNLTELMDKSLIQISDKKLEWREAIQEASKGLLEKKYINPEYVEAMIETVEDIGPYIVLAPKVAVPHARPERGVNKLGISLLKLNNEVNFNTNEEDDPDRYVSLIFVLAAIDGEAHLKALMQLSKILDDEDKIEKLISSDDVDTIYEAIEHFIREEE